MNCPLFKRLLFCLLLCSVKLAAQNYHAYNGSPYAGVFSMYNNPASPVNAAFKWDVNILSLQATITNGAFAIDGLKGNDTVHFGLTEGTSNRYLHTVANAELFNIRFNINKKTALAFALRGRTYNHVKTSAFYSSDTIQNFTGFLHANNNIQYLQGFATHDGWIEADVNFSHVLHEDMNSKFSAGITLGYMQNISGAFGSINKITYTEQTDAAGKYYQLINGGGATAMYSNNYDLAGNNGNNIGTFIKNTLSSFNISLGTEWLIKNANVYEDEPITNTNYDWKIGVSIMDIGNNNFQPAQGSFNAGVLKNSSGFSNTTIENRFGNIKSLQRLHDSVAQTFTNVDDITAPFSISTPTRLLVAVDRNFGNNFYTNAQLNINFFSTEPTDKIHTRELNGLTIVPRWEKKSIGFYLPMQYNTQGQFWMGAAIKLGPVLLGLHDLGWLFGRLDKLNGGGYLAIHIKAKEPKEKSKLDCSKNIN